MRRMLRTSDGVVVIITFVAPEEYEKARDTELKITEQPSHHPAAGCIQHETIAGRIEKWNPDAQ